MKKTLIIIAGVLIVIGAVAFYFRSDLSDIPLELEKSQLPAEVKNVATLPAITDTSTKFTGINLAVPFSSQAPYGDWGAPYGQACEEASAMLVDHFYKNTGLTPEIAKQELLKIVAWENKTFGYYEHTTAKETGRMLNEYFGYQRVEVNYDISLEDIKAQIMAGRPVIVPLAGRLINNPYYRQPGPIYHMLVIKGLTKDGNFITNDVGTRRGANYVYNAKVLYDAIHDAPFGGGELTTSELEKYIPTGRKAIIVVYPN
jgi:Peptidase_C39 like family